MSGLLIDLHTHSTASDGTTTPQALVHQAAQQGLDVMALTDHDTTEGWTSAVQALPPSLRLVRGAEISCDSNGISLHLLAYLFDPDEPALAAQLAGLRTSRIGRAERIVEQLIVDGIPVSWAQVRALADGTVGRPHIAQALVQSGQVGSIAEAFTPDWIGTHGRYWAGKLELNVLEAIGLVRAAGGVPVFAHPAAAARGRTVGDEVIAQMADAGLLGVEVDHVDHTPRASEHLRHLAADLNLLTTGSSDFHGLNKPVQLAAHTTAPEVFEQIAALATGVPVL